MTEGQTVNPEQPDGGLRLERRVMVAFAKLSGGFWLGETSRRAWGLTLGLVLVLSLSVGVTLAMNQWHKWFFNALEQKQGGTVGFAILVLGGIVAAMAGIGVGIVWTRESLQVRWREWLTGQLMTRWLDRNRFYHLGVTRTEPANPEYRIADDTRVATEILVDCAIGLFSAVIGATAFIGILWSVGGSLTVPVGQTSITIPAYMVLAALLYGCCASGLMLLVGRPLVGSVVAKNEAEGHFRFALMRVRDNAESIALAGGARSEHRLASELFSNVVRRWLGIVRQHANLTWITNASGPLVPIIGLIFATPKYMSGQLSLGEAMQLSAAFVQVQIAISWIVDNYNKIADWYASARRIIELTDACEQVPERLAQTPSPVLGGAAASGAVLSAQALLARDEVGNALSPAVSFDVLPGRQLALIGPSGSGKTSLVRLLAGSWPWGGGMMTQVPGARVIVLTQRPYVPSATLRGALRYPEALIGETAAFSQAAMVDALRRAGLGHLVVHLDDSVRLDRVLSSGDLQRLGIARVLLHRPEVVMIDEALSAFDDATQQALLTVLTDALPKLAIVTCSQTAATQYSGLRPEIVELVRNVHAGGAREGHLGGGAKPVALTV